MAVLAQELPSSQERTRRTTILDGREVAEGEVLVRYRAASGVIERQRAEFQSEADEVAPVGSRGVRRMRSRRLDVRAMLQALRANPDVEYAEPNYLLRVSATPNDPAFGALWSMFNWGQSIFGLGSGFAGADISATEAWDLATGDRSVVVGVIDSGIDYNHPDLAANIWTAPRAFTVTIGGVPITCAAGTHGFNAINNSCYPMDDNSHGTHVAGTIGAVGNNGIGVAGVNWVTSMMALKFLDSNGQGWLSDAIESIEFAIQARGVLGVDANVRVLSNSWGGGGYSQALKNEIDLANNWNMLFVAAAGNDYGLNNDVQPHYPSSYLSANMVAVASTDNRDLLSVFSNWGPASVDLSAPGSSIYSTVPSNGYGYKSGTSMATPQVAGAAALVLANCARTTSEIKSLLLSTADPIASMSGRSVTGGRLNVNAALRACLGTPIVHASVAGPVVSATVQNGPGNLRDWLGLYCPSTAADNPPLTWKYLNNSTTAPTQTGITWGPVTFNWPAAANQSCNVRLFLNNGYGRLATSANVVPTVTTVTVTSSMVGFLGHVPITITDAPGNRTDWIGVFPINAADNQYVHWVYLNGLKTPPATAVRNATLQLALPPSGGPYHVRLFTSDSFTKVATSNSFGVLLPPSIQINDVAVTEGNSGTSNATFTVTVNSWDGVPKTVSFETANGTAASGSDYIAASGTVTLSAAQTTVNVAINGDTSFEPNETFVVNLSNGSIPISDTQGVATIVNDDAAPPPAVAVNTPSVLSGEMISVSISNGPGNPADWVGLFPIGAVDTGYRYWVYLNGVKQAPATGLTNATVQLLSPPTPGVFEVRLFSNDSFTKLATSSTISVGGAQLPAINLAATTVTAGDSIGFTVNSGPLSTTDWVGLFPADASDVGYLSWMYLNGQNVAPVTPIQAAVMQFPAPLTPGTYNIRLFSNNGFTRLASSAVVTVTSPQPAVTAPVTTPRAGDAVTITVANGPRGTTDWVGLFPAGASHNGYVQWFYLNGTRTAPVTGIANATVTFTTTAVPGSYQVRLFSNDGFTLLAASPSFTIVP